MREGFDKKKKNGHAFQTWTEKQTDKFGFGSKKKINGRNKDFDVKQKTRIGIEMNCFCYVRLFEERA